MVAKKKTENKEDEKSDVELNNLLCKVLCKAHGKELSYAQIIELIK